MEQQERSNRKRLSLDIPMELYKEIARSTIDRNCTLTKWIIRALISELQKERRYNK